jgi:hypothetical protein
LHKIVSKRELNFLFDFVSRFIALSVFATVVAILGKPVFGTTDDNILAGFVDGSYTGERESKLIFIRPLIGSILNIFQELLPNMGVYSIFLLALLIGSFSNFGTLISFRSEDPFSRKMLNYLWLLASIPIITWFTLGPTYTAASMIITLVSLMSLAVLIFSKNMKKQIFVVVITTILFTFGFLIRPEGGIGIILVAISVISLIFLQQRNLNLSKLLITMFSLLIILGFDAVSQSSLNNSDWKEYDKWNNLRHQVQHRESQSYLVQFQKVNDWTVSETNLFMSIAFGDEKIFNAKWLKPAFDSTSFTRGVSGVLNANIFEVLGKMFKILETYPYVIVVQSSVFLIILNFFQINVLGKLKVFLAINSTIVAALYYMSATLHTPERGVIPLLYVSNLMLITTMLFFKLKDNLKITYIRILCLGVIGLSLLSPNGILETRSKNIANIELAILASRELIEYNDEAIYIGPGNSEFYEYRNPYTNLAYWRSPVIITAGNWETFSPHWKKRLGFNGINQTSIYNELFEENRFWFANPIPDTSYMVELYLREQGLTDFSRGGALDMKSGYVLHQFNQ